MSENALFEVKNTKAYQTTRRVEELDLHRIRFEARLEGYAQREGGMRDTLLNNLHKAALVYMLNDPVLKKMEMGEAHMYIAEVTNELAREFGEERR